MQITETPRQSAGGRRHWWRGILAVGLLAVSGCWGSARSLPTADELLADSAATAPGPAHPPDPRLKAQLERGRQALVLNCADCHSLPYPAMHPPGAWPALVAQMGPRSNLDAEDRAALTAYLSTAAAKAAGGAVSD